MRSIFRALVVTPVAPVAFSALLFLPFFVPPGAVAAECEDPKPLRFAQVPQKKAEVLSLQFRPLYEHLERKLGRRVEVIQASSYGAVVEGLLAGNIDIAELGPGAYAMAMHRNANIVAFASLSRQQGAKFDNYRSLLITRANSRFTQIDDLRGATVSLTDPASTSGALIPKKLVMDRFDLPPERFFKRVSYAGSHDRAIEAVQKAYVDAAFVTNTRVDEYIRRGLLKEGELKVLWQSDPIPFDPFVYREALCKPLTDKIRKAFLTDAEVLKPFFEELKRTGFAAVDDAHYRSIRELYATMPAE
jgi:phosphonate transport system substrate-binding protein